MGLYTDVEVHPSLLPEPYNNQSEREWQTKDVVFPEMETLRITEDGRLLYIAHEYEFVDPGTPHKGYGYFKPVKEIITEINYHGDMHFGYFDTETGEGVELVARFTNGKLDYIRRRDD